MGWLGRLFDERDTFVRMLLLDISGVGYLVFGPGTGQVPTGLQWFLAICAFAAVLVFHRRPVVDLVAQTALLALSIGFLDDPTISIVGSSWALLELAMWARRPRTVWLGTGLLCAVHLADSIGDPIGRLPASIFGLGVVVGLPLLLGLVIRTSRELGRQAEERAAEQRSRQESETRAARADERSAIARELHDVVAHHVASMVLRIGVARHVLPDLDPRVGEVFDDVHGTGTAALADLRRLVEVLRKPDGVRGDAALTAIEPSALPAALGAAVDRARRSGLTVEADVDPAVGRLDAVRGLAVLRLTQEALTNVAKHAGTSARARFQVALRDGDLHWQVSDVGGGAPAAVPPGGCHGITGMRERVEVLGGVLEAGPFGDGWRVATVLPAPASSSAASASAVSAQAAGSGSAGSGSAGSGSAGSGSAGSGSAGSGSAGSGSAGSGSAGSGSAGSAGAGSAGAGSDSALAAEVGGPAGRGPEPA